MHLAEVQAWNGFFGAYRFGVGVVERLVTFSVAVNMLVVFGENAVVKVSCYNGGHF